MGSTAKDRSTWKLLVLIGGLLLALLTVRYTPLYQYLDREQLRRLFSEIEAEPWAPLIFMTSLCLALSIGLPLTPFTLVGGVVFGVWPGALYNWLGTVAGATSAFLIGRTFGRGFVLKLLGSRLSRLQRMDETIALNGFWAIFTMRLIPIIPFNLSNFAAGLTGIRFVSYVAATALSLMPLVFIGTYFAHALWNGFNDPQARTQLMLATFLMLLVATIPWMYQRRLARSTTSGSPHVR